MCVCVCVCQCVCVCVCERVLNNICFFLFHVLDIVDALIEFASCRRLSPDCFVFFCVLVSSICFV